MDEYEKLDNLDNERGVGYTLFAIGESCSFFVYKESACGSGKKYKQCCGK